MSDASDILKAAEQGDPQAAEQLLPLVYDELRRLAAQRLASENPGLTLEATSLVHEAYLRLVGSEQSWNGRGHFFAAAAEAMRRILIERVRAKRRLRRGGNWQRVHLEEIPEPSSEADRLLAVDEVLDRLAAVDAQAAEVVKLRYFVGMTIKETATALGISSRTVNRHWVFARAWLYQQLKNDSLTE